MEKRRKPDSEVIMHSDKDCHYSCDGWQRFCWANELAWQLLGNAVAESLSFFSTLKKERFRKRIYKTWEYIFDYT
ncbi:hypothetical protein I5501_23290 [Citrobacter freundii]|nr:hypothetical protein [Citrobacter freundii]